MKQINYIKPPNCDKLFKKLEGFQFTNCQNYNPIYEIFFNLSPQNYNQIHLNHKYHLIDILSTESSTNQHSVFNSVLQDCASCPPNTLETNTLIKHQNIKNTKKPYTFKQNIFVKIAPLLDPLHFISGKYDVSKTDTFTKFLPVPACMLTDKHILPKEEIKVNDVNNVSYVDGFFSFLSNQLVENFHFTNGIKYYGSFLSVKKNFMFNIADDIHYLVDCDFFNTNQKTMFEVQDYSHLIETEEPKPRLNLKPLDSYSDAVLSFDDVSTVDVDVDTKTEAISIQQQTESVLLTADENTSFAPKLSSASSGTSCSTISSTSSKSGNSNENSDDDTNEDSDDDTNEDSDDDTNEDSNDNCSSDNDEEEQIYATIPQFPVQLICLEKCVETLGDYTDSKKISDAEWFAILMQVIMSLAVYQKTYHFTHNDLHTNNIMYVETKKKFIYYRYNQVVYRVPTFGKIYKIIDFGRAIFDYRGKRFCSDSFQKHGDAHSQYNTEPYFDDSKVRVDPNYSFDLCRLACTVFDDLLNVDFSGECSMTELVTKTNNPVAKLIADWCTSDDGKNVLYKDNGDERYPDFKLYKMIARRVHKHTPQAQLLRPEFKQFECKKNQTAPKDMPFVNIDAMECYA